MELTPEPIDWKYVNKLPSLSIYALVLLSLGLSNDYGPHPFGGSTFEIDGKPCPPPTADYTERLSLAIAHADHGSLPTTGRTILIGQAFDKDAKPADAQFWSIECAEFRRFCDRMQWSVPPEFLPLGYAPPSADSPETPTRKTRTNALTGTFDRAVREATGDTALAKSLIYQWADEQNHGLTKTDGETVFYPGGDLTARAINGRLEQALKRFNNNARPV